MKRTAALAFMLVSLWAPAAHAEDRALATELFLRGRELLAAGRIDEACEKFRASHALDPSGGAILNLAVCDEARQRTATAWSEFREALSLARRDQRADRIAFAEEHLASLEPRLSRLRVVVQDSEASVLRDGAALPAAAWGESVPIDPGPHVIEARAPGRIAVRVVVSLGPNADARVVTIRVLARVAPPPPPVHRTPRIVLGLGLGAVAASVVGTVAGVHAIAERRASDHLCAGGCDEEGVRFNERAQTWADVSTVAFVVAGVATAVAVISAVVASGESRR